MAAMSAIPAPINEGLLRVRDGRVLSYAEFGDPGGAVVIWMHGTPGGRRQVPADARRFAASNGVRIIGLDRPGIGDSTPHLYENVLDWTGELPLIAEQLRFDRWAMIGLSGGGPYALAAAAAFPDAVPAVGVLGGVAPRAGSDAIRGGLMEAAPLLTPVASRARLPLAKALSAGIRAVTPLADAAIEAYAAVQPRGDKELLRKPEFKRMFVDDLLNATRSQVGAPLADLLLFSRHWGFQAADVAVPVFWWHGDADHIVPHRHGRHLARRLPSATFTTMPGEAHLGGLDRAVEVLTAVLGAPGWQQQPAS